MKLGFIGMGFVGGTTAKVLSEAHEVLAYDKYKDPYKDPKVLKDAEVVFICVPTPMKPSGEIDYSAIYNSLDTLSEVKENESCIVVIRSTAVSGTTDTLKLGYPHFSFVFNPEFLREKYALEDMWNTNRIVIGANRDEDFEKVKQVYLPLFSESKVKYIHVDRKTAEMIKYSSNAMLFGQIALANELYKICEAVDVNYDEVKNVLLLDNRIGRNINVPGPDGDFGGGGKCLIKDINALIYLAREKMYRPYLLEEVWRLNERVRKNKDWLEIPGATSGNQNFEGKDKK